MFHARWSNWGPAPPAALDAEPETVNWRRGLTRLGVAAAAIWLLIAGVVYRLLQSIAAAMGWGEPHPPPGFLVHH
jgi:hypothetical protein